MMQHSVRCTAVSRVPLSVLVLATLYATSLAGQTPATCPDPTSVVGSLDGVRADVRYLADDRLEGREVGSAGARCASDYLAERFRRLGLAPGGPEGSWFHTFPVRVGTTVGTHNRLEISGRAYAPERDWVPLGFSSTEDEDGDLVYGGPLLSAPGQPDDRWAHLELDGKIVVVEAGTGRSFRDDPHFKATVAAGRDAAGVILLLPEGAPLPDPARESRAALDIPVLAVSGAAADAIREAARAAARAHITTDVAPTVATARNVVAVLAGSDPDLRDEYVVVGAHYDHLGMGGEGSLDPDARRVHNGADDNASGTAGVVEIARRLLDGPRPERSVIFMAFTGEEKGLWGSARWVEHPTVDLDHVVAMINLDMVGRLRQGEVTVYGVGTAQEWPARLEAVNRGLAAPLTVATIPDGYGPSDHASFAAAGIPVLHFFTNTHAEYHRPEDDWDLIEYGGIERVAELAAGVTRDVADAAGTPLTRVAQDLASAHGGAAPEASSSSGSSGYGPYLGTIPDMTPRDNGLRLTGVREDSPAARAGLQEGDVVVEFGGKPVTDIYTYTYALRDHEPGDRVEIVVERDGRRVTVFAVLEAR